MLNGESLSVEELQDEIERLRQILERKLQVGTRNYSKNMLGNGSKSPLQVLIMVRLPL